MDICDFHSHILPSADHGSSSVEESLKQLNLAKRYGVSRIVATSHFYPHRDSVEAFLNRRDAAYSTLVATMPDGMPEVKLAAEVLLCANLDELPDLCDLCILGTNTLLIELPFNDFGNEYVHAVEGMIDRGYRVILAHAECYDAQNVERLIALGALVQINASALAGTFTKKAIKSWKKRHKIVALGSDIHGADRHAYKNFVRAIRRLGDYAEYVKEKSDMIWESSAPL